MTPNYELLKKLVKYMETVPEEQFDFSTWGTNTNLGACGTRACALGWATMIPETGLRLKNHAGLVHIEHKSSGAREVYAAVLAFGLSYAQARQLFLSGPEWLGAQEGPLTAKKWAEWAGALIERWRLLEDKKEDQTFSERKDP